MGRKERVSLQTPVPACLAGIPLKGNREEFLDALKQFDDKLCENEPVRFTTLLFNFFPSFQ